MELVAGKSAKHEAEAIAKFWDQENTNLDSSLFIEVGCKSAEIKTMMSSFFWEGEIYWEKILGIPLANLANVVSGTKEGTVT